MICGDRGPEACDVTIAVCNPQWGKASCVAAVTAALPPLLSFLSSLQPLMLSREGEAGCGNAQWRGVLEVAAGAKEILGSGGGGGLCELAASVRVALLRLHRCV